MRGFLYFYTVKNTASTTFEKYVPSAAVNYCQALWQSEGFLLKITPTRRSKLGDYCYHPVRGHQITINHDLNAYAFLITYLHEVAHLMVFKRYGSRRAPHGKEWKQCFVKLLKPVMTETYFPPTILLALEAYCLNPTAATNSFLPLKTALQPFDPLIPGLLPLHTLPEGALFELNQRCFKRLQMRRTRVLCADVHTGKKYTVGAAVLVKKKA
jgi:SprT protein